MRIADVLPLTPLQQGLLFHASTAQGSDDVYAVQLDISITGALDPHRLREAVRTVVNRHPNLAGGHGGCTDAPTSLTRTLRGGSIRSCGVGCGTTGLITVRRCIPSWDVSTPT